MHNAVTGSQPNLETLARLVRGARTLKYYREGRRQDEQTAKTLIQLVLYERQQHLRVCLSDRAEVNLPRGINSE